MTRARSGPRPGDGRSSRDRPSRYEYATVRLTFRSGGERCVGRLYRPDRPSSPPAVVLAGGPIAAGGRPLRSYAERLAAAGYAVFGFDFRHAGDSDGEPRNLVSPPRQRADWEAALAGLRGRGDVATDSVLLWGAGLAARGALDVAADDPRVAGVVAQTPILSGRAFLRDRGLRFLAGGLLAGVRDRLQSPVVGPHRLPVVDDEAGSRLALVSTAGASRRYRTLADEGWDNRTPARSILSLWRDTGDADRTRPTCPVLLVGGTHDDVTDVEAVAETLPDATLVRLPAGHLDLYDGRGFERCLRHGLAFLDATERR